MQPGRRAIHERAGLPRRGDVPSPRSAFPAQPGGLAAAERQTGAVDGVPASMASSSRCVSPRHQPGRGMFSPGLAKALGRHRVLDGPGPAGALIQESPGFSGIASLRLGPEVPGWSSTQPGSRRSTGGGHGPGGADAGSPLGGSTRPHDWGCPAAPSRQTTRCRPAADHRRLSYAPGTSRRDQGSRRQFAQELRPPRWARNHDGDFINGDP